MPHLRELMAGGEIADLVPSFPCVTCPVQANMTTGKRPNVARRGGQRLLLARPPAGRDVDLAQRVHRAAAALGPPLAPRGRADLRGLVPAAQQGLRGGLRLHARPDPQSRRLRVALVLHAADRALRHAARPARAFSARCTSGARWPTSNRRPGSLDSAVYAAKTWRPDFFYIYLPHLDYAAQRHGPDSPQADAAVAELDRLLGRLARRLPRSLRRRAPVARGRRIRHQAGRARDVSQPRACARPASWRSARKPTASISTSPPARPGPWSTTSSPTSSWPTATRP